MSNKLICPDATPVLKILSDLRESIIVDLKSKYRIIELISENEETQEDLDHYFKSFMSLIESDEFDGEFGWGDFPSYDDEEVANCFAELDGIVDAIGIVSSLVGSAQRYEQLTIARDFFMGKI